MTAPPQQQRIDEFVHSEAKGGQPEEARQRAQQRRAMPSEGAEVVPHERHAYGRQPSEDVGHQGLPTSTFHQQHDDAPVDGRGPATHEDKSMDATGLPKRLCICIDDVGLHSGINQAALELVARKRVHALACQVGGPGWPSAAPALRHLHAVDVGLHLDLTECTVAEPRHQLGGLIAASMLRQLSPVHLTREIAAQLDRFEETIGRAPDFVDGHQHVHQLSQVRDELLSELERRGHVRTWLRSTRRRKPLPGTWQMRFKPWLIEHLGMRGLARMARERSYGQNEALLGVYDFTPSNLMYSALLYRWIEAAKDGDLLMCHPSLPVIEQRDAILLARIAEFDVLSTSAFDEYLRAHHVTLAPLSQTLDQTPR